MYVCICLYIIYIVLVTCRDTLVTSVSLLTVTVTAHRARMVVYADLKPRATYAIVNQARKASIVRKIVTMSASPTPVNMVEDVSI